MKGNTMTGRTFKGLFATALVIAVLAFGFALPTAAFAEIEYGGTQTVTLTQDLTDVVIAAGANVTINLNGHKISSSAASTSADDMHHAITNYGTLTINGSGTVDGGSYAVSGAVYTAPGATTTLNGGTYTSSKWYVIKNLGTMTISDGVTVTSYDQGASVIANGYAGNSGNSSDCWIKPDGTNKPKLTVNGGIFNSDPNDLASIKNDDYGIVEINDGTFTGTCALSNHNIATINGGSFSSTRNDVIQNCPCDSTSDVGELTVTGGTFDAGDGKDGNPYPVFKNLKPSATFGFIRVSGGTYSSDPTDYLVDDYSATKDGDNYTVKQHKLTKTDAKEATCTEDGNNAYWTCSLCNKVYADEDAQTETTVEDQTIAAHHTLVEHAAKSATATEAGNIEYYTCSVCDKYFTDADGKNETTADKVVIPATGKTDGGDKKDDSATKKESKKALPQTGDATSVASMAAAAFAGLVSVAGALALKKH